MKHPGTYIERAPGSLKDAENALVTACGGQEKASSLTRVRPSQMQRYTAPSEPDCHMPLDVVLALELHCGVPHVTRFLALETQHILVDIGETETAPAAVHMANIGQETGALFKEFAESLADGSISAKEAGRLRAAAMKDIIALGALFGDLNRVQRGGA